MRSLAACLLLCTFVGPLCARPAYLRAVGNHFGSAMSDRLNACSLCHTTDKPSEEDEETHNAFGKRMVKLKKELRRAGKKSGIVERVEAAALEDADGDGVPNSVEILTGHRPGDRSDVPNAVEVADGQKKAAAWQAALPTYAWEPFEPVRRPAVPKINRPEWVRNPIDVFLAEMHQKRGLTPRPSAKPATLLRRVYLDLTGLPPTTQEVEAFLADPSPAAYERVVDRLLASSAYGERWGRHWMDVWRYSDWAGYQKEVRYSQPHIWRWRDWIVEALNADKPYDRMIVEMLAADEIAPDDPATLRATGFLVRNWYKFNRNVWLDNIVEHTGKAFLGVTLNCARCHDHFFDPITQKEYYSFRAIFEPHDIRVDRVAGEADTNKSGLVRVYDARLDTATYLFQRGNEAKPDKSQTLVPAVPVALKGGPLQSQAVPLPAAATSPGLRDFVLQEDRTRLQAAIQKGRQALAVARTKTAAALIGFLTGGGTPLNRVAALAPLETQVLKMRLAEATAETAQARQAAFEAALAAERLEQAGKKDSAEWRTAAQTAQTAQRQQAWREAQQALLAAQQPPRPAKKLADARQALTKTEAERAKPVTTAYTPLPHTSFPAQSSGRRLALARWIAARNNPLAARVAVNHIWLRHFGQALVPSVFDFGKNGQPPSHPALLDWLAAEFMDHGWRMKPLHRLIVTSRAYQMASTHDAANAAIDQDNRLLWRTNVRRMEAETVRDALLFAAGKLDRTIGGPEIEHQKGLTVPRRSLYFQQAAEKQMTFLQLFDAANVVECYQRNETIVPQQALALANSSLARAMSAALAEELTRAHGPAENAGTNPAFVRAAFVRILSRPPTATEVATCLRFLTRSPAPMPPARARQDLVHVLFNHNDFVSIR